MFLGGKYDSVTFIHGGKPRLDYNSVIRLGVDLLLTAPRLRTVFLISLRMLGNKPLNAVRSVFKTNREPLVVRDCNLGVKFGFRPKSKDKVPQGFEF